MPRGRSKGRGGAGREEYARMTALSKQMDRAVHIDLLTGLTTFRRRVDPAELAAAYRTGEYERVMRAIPWHKLPGEVDPAMEKLAETARKGAKASFGALPAPVKAELRYDVQNPKLERYVSQRTGELITTVRKGTLTAVRQATRRALVHGLSPAEVAAEIRGAIGLNERQATALASYRNRLAQDEVGPRRAAQLAKAYENRLLDQRAMMIARTEVRFAANEGQQDVWESASRKGLLPKGTQRVWVVDGKPCENLCLPMRNVAVGLHERWQLPDGRLVDNPTESHPHCYCVVSLELGEG